MPKHYRLFAVILSCLVSTYPRSVRCSEMSEVFVDGDVRLHALLMAPDGAGPFPAVVAMHGCSGLTTSRGRLTRRHRDWADRLVSNGFVVLLPDSYTSRNLGPQCRHGERAVRPARERVSDAKAALRYLQSLR